MMTKPSPTLLVVDDDVSIRTTLSLLFTHLGYNVRCAGDGFTALESIEECRPDVLLSDLHMPGMSGFELLSVVRRVYPAIHVVATSGAFCGRTVPGGVAADAFYEKATGLSFLFDAVGLWAQTGEAIRRASDRASPIWISPTGRLSSGEVYVLIGCPRCLRAFPKILPDTQQVARETDCHYCGAGIWFAIAPSADSSLEMHSCTPAWPKDMPTGVLTERLATPPANLSLPFDT